MVVAPAGRSALGDDSPDDGGGADPAPGVAAVRGSPDESAPTTHDTPLAAQAGSEAAVDAYTYTHSWKCELPTPDRPPKSTDARPNANGQSLNSTGVFSWSREAGAPHEAISISVPSSLLLHTDTQQEVPRNVPQIGNKVLVPGKKGAG